MPMDNNYWLEKNDQRFFPTFEICEVLQTDDKALNYSVNTNLI